MEKTKKVLKTLENMVVCLLLVGVAPLKHAYDYSIYAGQRKATIHDGKCAWGIGRVALLRDRNGGSGRVALLRDRNGRKSGGLRSCATATGGAGGLRSCATGKTNLSREG